MAEDIFAVVFFISLWVVAPFFSARIVSTLPSINDLVQKSRAAKVAIAKVIDIETVSMTDGGDHYRHVVEYAPDGQNSIQAKTINSRGAQIPAIGDEAEILYYPGLRPDRVDFNDKVTRFQNGMLAGMTMLIPVLIIGFIASNFSLVAVAVAVISYAAGILFFNRRPPR